MKKLRRVLSVGLSLALCAGMVLPALAVEYDISKGDVIIDSTGSSGVVMGQEESSRNEFTEDDRSVTISQSEAGPTGHTITVGENVTDTTITLNGVNIDASGSGKAAMSVGTSSDVTVELDGENTLKSGADHAGLELNGGGSVTIQDETTKDDGAALTANGGNGGAGIGSGYWAKAGSITINGGDVTATGGNGNKNYGYGGGVGIGSGYWAEAGSITINGGDVTAKGGKQGAGIGSGNRGNIGDITINGGDIFAQGGGRTQTTDGGGAGIGSGDDAKASNITITGGEVTGNGDERAAGIGSSAYSTIGNITITGGEVTGNDLLALDIQPVFQSRGKLFAGLTVPEFPVAIQRFRFAAGMKYRPQHSHSATFGLLAMKCTNRK